MALIDELKEQLKQAIFEEGCSRQEIASAQEELAEKLKEIDDLHVAIAALEPPGEAAIQSVEPSSQSEPFVSLAAETDLPTPPGGAEESRDHSDDASEFSEEGYAPVTQAEPPAMEGVAFVDGKWTIPEPSFEKVDDDGLEHIAPADEANHPQAAYIAPTDPEADAIAKALDHYDPKAMAERNKFNPFSIFKREDA